MSGQGGSAGTVVEPPTSNPPGVTFEVQTNAGAQGLVLVSSNVISEPDPAYLEWYGIVRNAGSETLCQVRADLTFHTALGTTLVELLSYSNAEPYESGLTSSIACIAPGKFGTFWTNDLPSAAIELTAIRTIRVALNGNRYPTAVPHPMVPAVMNAAIAEHSTGGTGTWTVTGTMTATDTIYNLLADIDLVSAEGWIVDRVAAYHLETFTEGTTWPFETTSYFRGTRPVEFLLFPEFIEGAQMAASTMAPDDLPAQAARVAEIARHVRDLRAEQRARRARILALRH